MIANTAQALDVLQEAILRRLGDEVDLIFRYGSSIRGTTHPYSDLDLSYVPVHETTWDNITVMVDDTMIDLYPIHWSRLQQMSEFEDPSCTVLLENEIVYQRSQEAAERFRQLAIRLREMQQPDAQPAAIRKAHDLFQGLGYPYYLLRQQARRGHLLSCMQHSRQILSGVVHCLAVCNQAIIDTRKLNQVLGLAMLPEGFADTVDRITTSTDSAELLEACETLMETTRVLLRSQQDRSKAGTMGFPEVFGAGYPELKGDLTHLMLACERRDRFNFNLMSLYHELMIHTAQALTGIEYSSFNSIAEYEQDLAALGFPDLLPYAAAGDFDGLHEQCRVFDIRLREFLTERGVSLYTFANVDELKKHLE